MSSFNASLRTPKGNVLPTNGVLPILDINPHPEPHVPGKLRAFRNSDDAWRAGKWLQAFVGRLWDNPNAEAEKFCNHNGLQVTNAGTEGTGSAGGYLVPSVLSNSIIATMEKVGVARQLVPPTPMTSDTLTVPVRSSGLTVYYPGEANLITDSDMTWSQIQLIAKKRSVAHFVSQELIDDALIAIVDRVAMEMAHALAAREDAEFFSGDGTSTYGGVTGVLTELGAGGIHTAASGIDTWDELTLADFTNTMAKLPDRYHVFGPSWVCSSAFYHSVLLRIQAAAGGNTVADVQDGDGSRRRFLGHPVYLTEQMPRTTAASTVCALFGAFNAGVVFGERIGLRFGRSDDYKFLNDLVTLKASSRYDMNVHAPGDANNAGAYVGLSTNS